MNAQRIQPHQGNNNGEMSYQESASGLKGGEPGTSEYLVDYVTDGTTLCSAQYKEKLPKICKVCGDVAKSYHFGGLSCDSCKAFFRRTVQSESWETFLCVTGGNCQITPNKRSCQACRYESCRKIGMDPSLVMTMSDRKALMYRKLERKKQQLLENYKQMDLQHRVTEPAGWQETVSASNSSHHEASMEWNHWNSDDNIETSSVDVSCAVEDVDDCLIIETLSEKNREKIKGLQKIMQAALTFPEFPKHYYEEDADVTEHLFFVFCKGMGKFFSLVPEFRDLDDNDRGVLLKDAVAKSIFVFGAHQFQEVHECWPRKLLSPFCTFPTISLATTEKFIDDADTFQKMKTFMRKYCKFFDDEVVTLISLMIGAFDTDLMSLTDLPKVVNYKEIYVQLLEDYVHYRNASISVTSFSLELWDCFAEVKDLKECFQKGATKDKKDKSPEEKDEASFASSLNDLGEDPKMPPKKAFSERIKAKESSYSTERCLINEFSEKKLKATTSVDLTQSENDKQTTEEDDIIITSEKLQKTYFTVTQDHNYQKPRARLPPKESHYNNRFQESEEEVQILPSDRMNRVFPQSAKQPQQMKRAITPNISGTATFMNDHLQPEDYWVPNGRFPTICSMQTSPAGLVPIAPQGNPCSPMPQSIQVGYPSYHSSQVDLSKVYQTNVFDTGLYRPKQPHMYSSTNERHVTRELRREPEFISLENTTSSRAEIFQPLAVSGTPVQMPVGRLRGALEQLQAHHNRYPEHTSIASEVYTTQQQGFPPSTCEPARLSMNRILQDVHSRPQKSRQSPMSDICNNLNHLSTQDDHQLVEAVQDVLPPHLVKQLINRLSNGQ
ncbi:uncharacterized protein LOC135208604 [Macrobrachium nipponense]|uniref:uncharacterized protein LOC135208604 n=1 Tax=Macrobrachium nipponense TaxID=159736 RepID=UPI0030C82088